MINTYAKIVLLMLLSGCGPLSVDVKDSTHRVDGDPTITVDWGFDQFEGVFRDDCQKQFDEEKIDDVEQCIADKVVKLIELVENGYNNNANQEE